MKPTLILLTALLLAPLAALHAAEDSVREMLRRPQAKMFWIERQAGKVTMGDPVSYYSKTTDFDELTFDIGNAKCLANVNMLGVVKALTIYRDSYRARCDPSKGWPGVWLAKDNSSFGPYAMRFSVSTHNLICQPKVHAITWAEKPMSPLEDRIPTAPGYNKGLAFADDRDSLFGEHGYYTEIRRVTDTDGTVPWWPYKKPEPGNVRRSHPGKAGWFAGVYSVLFVDRFLGLRYDAPRQTLRFTPHPAIGDFAWTDFPMGRDRFSVSYRQGVATFKNSAAHPVTLAAGSATPVTVPAGETATSSARR
jgi:hypothetical protein